MRKSIVRAAIAAAGLLSAVSFASAAQATDFSINTNVPGGSAWVTNPPGYLTGTLHLTDPNYAVTAYVGVINLHGELVNEGNVTTDLKVFCIDITNDLANGTFTETTLANIESDQGGMAHVLYTSAQVQNLTRFLAYARNQGITDSFSSAVAQLGVWEIISEASTDYTGYDLNSGNLRVDGMDSNVLSAANSWIAASQNQSTLGYTLHVLDPGAHNQMQAFVTYLPGNNVQLGVPEPATWGMIVLGFGLLGSALRRRKQDKLFA